MAGNSREWDLSDDEVPAGLQPALLLSIGGGEGLSTNDVVQDILSTGQHQDRSGVEHYNEYDFEEGGASKKKRGERQKLWTEVYANEAKRKEVLPRLRVYIDRLMALRKKEAEKTQFELVNEIATSGKKVRDTRYLI